MKLTKRQIRRTCAAKEENEKDVDLEGYGLCQTMLDLHPQRASSLTFPIDFHRVATS
jgi:hypothetical protein